ncbi:hypothetical protein BHM03_00004762 [Ensete ventricosum]|uniref:Uncharacterized protein n=1 Tax=Ensete ventricosum TaxID=4639 RepID=A0A445MB00_ENSVE|nr:hypothetical protein BHM03_00004762 [Ensete ventricosum]
MPTERSCTHKAVEEPPAYKGGAYRHDARGQATYKPLADQAHARWPPAGRQQPLAEGNSHKNLRLSQRVIRVFSVKKMIMPL